MVGYREGRANCADRIWPLDRQCALVDALRGYSRLASKGDGRGALPHRLSLLCFVIGIVFAFGTAAAAWFNFSVSEEYFKRLTDAEDKWRELSLDTHSKWMRRTSYFAIASAASSIICLIVGAVIAIL